MIHLHNSGSAYDIGWQHGRSCPVAVHLAYEAWGQIKDVEPAQIEVGIRLVEERLDKFFPEILAEMQGIAAGSGLPYQQILLLNCFDVIIGNAVGGPACSNIGFVASDVGVLLGKTADWNVAGPENFAAWQQYQPAAGQGYTFIHYGCAGTLWTEGGLNETGLGMVLNGLPGSGAKPDSVPWPPLTRGVLQHCHNVQEAIDFLSQHDLMYWGVNMSLADARGDLAFVEVVPGAQAIFRPQIDDYLIHTNHCLLPETIELQPEPETVAAYGQAGLVENSQARYQNLEAIVPPAPRTLAGMQALLRNRSMPGAISQHGEQGIRTCYAMIIAPEQGKLWGVEGYPPDFPFVGYEI